MNETGTGERHRRLTGRLRVPLPPAQAFRLFTPLGERDWAPDWEPRFPVPTGDDSQPGTVFETGGQRAHPADPHDVVRTWLVVDRKPGRRIRYANVAPDNRASLITVELAPAAGGSDVTVTYDVTALSGAGARELADFANGYRQYLDSWQEQITAHVSGPSSSDR